MTLMPRESGKLIAKLAKSVYIKEEGVKNVAYEIMKGLKNRTVALDNFSQLDFHPDANDSKAMDWIFVLDTLNFSFWSDNKSKFMVNGNSGYFALCAAIKRAIDSGVPITDAKFYSKIKREELEKIMEPDEGCSQIPMIEERVESLHQAGRVLIEKFNGTFADCVKQSGNSAEKLLKLIVEEFECYRDEATFHGTRVSFYKRAQILVGDIWACFRGKGPGEFHDIGAITMFADYRVPQVLIHFGAMQYSDSLVNKLRSGQPLQVFGEEEVEIRGCSIEVVERVCAEVKNMIRNAESGLENSDINAIMIDHFLWDYRRAHAKELESIPYHQIRTIYY